jgi:hypothetical protein
MMVVLLPSLRTANATAYVWSVAGDGNWHVAGFWAPVVPPGPPGLGDTAGIHAPFNVMLAANAQGLAGLAISANADLFTNGNQLTVVNIAGDAAANVVGIGSTGQNTELFVTPVGGITAGFTADNMNLVNGGELDLTNGGITHIRDRLDVDAISIITGDGTIVFTDSFNVAGRRLDLRGTIRPDTNDTITLVAESGSIDLDGFEDNDNFVDLTNSGSGLVVDGPLHDSFTGTMEFGTRATFTSTHDWEVGLAGGANGPSLIRVDAGAGDATIAGSEVTFGVDAHVAVVSGLFRVEADSRFQSNADIFVAGGAEMKIGIQTGSSIITGGSWTGDGAVNLDAGINTIAADTTVNMPNGTFDIDGNTTSDTVVINQTLLLNVASLDDEDFDGIDGTTQINGAAGQLNVNFSNPNKEYRFEGILDLNGPAGGLTGIHLAGADVELDGMTTVSGSSTTQARVRITGDLDIANGAAFNLQGGSSSNPNVVHSTASFTGGGDLRVLPGAQLNVEDGTSTAINVVNDGRFEPGTSLGSVALREFVQNAQGTLAMEINGPPGVGQDEILTTGASQVDGELEVTVLGGFIPTLGQVYSLLIADSVAGTFSNLTMLSDSIFEYEATLSYPGARVVLQFTDVSMLGDFSDDLALGCDDVNSLVAEIASGGVDLEFDMNSDGQVDLDDLDEWLDVAGTFNVGGPYLGGDANLDGFVDGLDFIEWNGNKFTATAAWCSGDFNADGFIDGLDFIIWNGNKFMSSDHAAAIPEPCSQLLFLIALAMFARRRRT